jgi:aspartyl-tRNA(Asn)/glutamyl-tRNA(Gln) amidotransferase subunit A
MTDTPWLGDAVSLVEAFRSGDRSPKEELEATLSAIESSQLNAFSHVDADRCRSAAAEADIQLPLGGVPYGVKELEPFAGWPFTGASVALKDHIGTHTSLAMERAMAGGVNPVGQTTASEFGGLNVSVSKLNGVTGNPWRPSQTAGGSSGGSAAAVAGGLLTLASGGDGGGSIRIPAGFNGLVGMKGTAGRIPRGPRTGIAPLTVVLGCLARSVRDVARFYDLTTGYDMRDPYSLQRIDGWERDLGSHDLKGLKVVIDPSLGGGIVRDEVAQRVQAAAESLAADVGLRIVDVPIEIPGFGFEWAMANMATLVNELGDAWPACKDDLTTEMAFGLTLAEQQYDLTMAAAVEAQRTETNEGMAVVFDEVDLIICATNPDVAYPADVTLNLAVGAQQVGPENNGHLTIPANIVGNPAISVPVEQFDGLPVGMQIIARHHDDQLLLDLGAVAERERPWPLVATDSPH